MHILVASGQDVGPHPGVVSEIAVHLLTFSLPKLDKMDINLSVVMTSSCQDTLPKMAKANQLTTVFRVFTVSLLTAC